jgi:hypothetical protein
MTHQLERSGALIAFKKVRLNSVLLLCIYKMGRFLGRIYPYFVFIIENCLQLSSKTAALTFA